MQRPDSAEYKNSIDTVTDDSSNLPTLQYSNNDSIQEFWIQVFRQMPSKGLVKMVASHCEGVSFENQTFTLRLDEQQQALYNEYVRQTIETDISQVLSTKVDVVIECGVLIEESIAQNKQRKNDEQHMFNVSSLSSDERIQNILKTFSARIDEKSVITIEDDENINE
jgi:hypothetical protein